MNLKRFLILTLAMTLALVVSGCNKRPSNVNEQADKTAVTSTVEKSQTRENISITQNDIAGQSEDETTLANSKADDPSPTLEVTGSDKPPLYSQLTRVSNDDRSDADCPEDAVLLGSRIARWLDYSSDKLLYKEVIFSTLSANQQQAIITSTTGSLPTEDAVRQKFVSVFGSSDAVTESFLNSVKGESWDGTDHFFQSWDPPCDHYVSIENCHLISADEDNEVYSFAMDVASYTDTCDYITSYEEHWEKEITGVLDIDTKICTYEEKPHLVLIGLSYTPNSNGEANENQPTSHTVDNSDNQGGYYIDNGKYYVDSEGDIWAVTGDYGYEDEYISSEYIDSYIRGGATITSLEVVQEFTNNLKAITKEVAQETGVPEEVLIAFGLNKSMYGTLGTVELLNNVYLLKAGAGESGVPLTVDYIDSWTRLNVVESGDYKSYSSIEESVRDFADYVKYRIGYENISNLMDVYNALIAAGYYPADNWEEGWTNITMWSE